MEGCGGMASYGMALGEEADFEAQDFDYAMSPEKKHCRPFDVGGSGSVYVPLILLLQMLLSNQLEV